MGRKNKSRVPPQKLRAGKNGNRTTSNGSDEIDLRADVLILTVNQHETKALLSAFEHATGMPASTVMVGERAYRDLGIVNGARIFHALSEMGSGGVGGTAQSVALGIRSLGVSAAIAVGVAFGMNESAQAAVLSGRHPAVCNFWFNSVNALASALVRELRIALTFFAASRRKRSPRPLIMKSGTSASVYAKDLVILPSSVLVTLPPNFIHKSCIIIK